MRKKLSRNIYYENITYDNMFNIWKIVRRTCNSKRSLFYYSFNINTNLITICNKLYNKTYTPSKFKTFLIFEPKPRLIMNQIISDKIVNHFVVNYYLIPYLESSLIDSNVATRRGKGSSYGNNLLKRYFNKLLINNKDCEIYCLKMDVSKYFYSINHNILMGMLGKKIKDKDVLNIIKLVISQTNNDYINKNISYYNNKYNTDIPYYINDTGLSIGAMVSQFLAIFFLNEIDHYIKEENLSVIFDLIKKETTHTYYIDMAISWLLCELYVKFTSNTYEFIKNTKLPDFIVRKATSKVYDSFRVSKEDKDKLKKLKDQILTT